MGRFMLPACHAPPWAVVREVNGPSSTPVARVASCDRCCSRQNVCHFPPLKFPRRVSTGRVTSSIHRPLSAIEAPRFVPRSANPQHRCIRQSGLYYRKRTESPFSTSLDYTTCGSNLSASARRSTAVQYQQSRAYHAHVGTYSVVGGRPSRSSNSLIQSFISRFFASLSLLIDVRSSSPPASPSLAFRRPAPGSPLVPVGRSVRLASSASVSSASFVSSSLNSRYIGRTASLSLFLYSDMGKKYSWQREGSNGRMVKNIISFIGNTSYLVGRSKIKTALQWCSSLTEMIYVQQ